MGNRFFRSNTKFFRRIYDGIKSRWDKYPLREKADFAQVILAIGTIALVVITFWGIKQSNKYTRQQIELHNRPYLAVVNPGYFIRPIETGQWQYAGYFPVVNYGNKPAYELKLINDKVILIETSKEKFKELNDILNDGSKSQQEKDVAYAEYISYRKELVKLLYDYLEKNPKATTEQVASYFRNTKKYKKQLKRMCLDKGGNPNFKVDCRGDIYEGYPESSLLLPYNPEDDNPKRIFQLGREIHPNTDLHIKNYDKILLVYFVAQYEGIVKQSSPYFIYYIGYHDEFLAPVRIKKIADYEKESIDSESRKLISLIPFIEFKMWSDRSVIE